MKWLEQRRARKRIAGLPVEGVIAITAVEQLRFLATQYDNAAATYRQDGMRLGFLGYTKLRAETARDAELMGVFARKIREAIGDLQPEPHTDSVRMDR